MKRLVSKLALAMLVIFMLLPVLWRLFAHDHGTKVPAVVDIASLVAVAVASAWFCRHISLRSKRGIVPTTTFGGERIKKSTRLVLECLCGQAIGSFVAWFFLLRTSSVPAGFTIGMLIFGNVMLFIWFLQGRSSDKESFSPRVW